ncbi:MAG TPA: hypothetical protein DFS52_25820, partial [Myxococcales bacterium]|nr:hypothetical protein [Myxococcales bacterium]
REQGRNLLGELWMFGERCEGPPDDVVVLLLRGELPAQQPGAWRLLGRAFLHDPLEQRRGLPALLGGGEPLGVGE